MLDGPYHERCCAAHASSIPLYCTSGPLSKRSSHVRVANAALVNIFFNAFPPPLWTGLSMGHTGRNNTANEIGSSVSYPEVGSRALKYVSVFGERCCYPLVRVKREALPQAVSYRDTCCFIWKAAGRVNSIASRRENAPVVW